MRILVERVCTALGAAAPVVERPFRVKRNQVVKAGEIEKHVTFLGNRVGDDGAILIVLDADDECAATLGPQLLARAQAARPDRRIGLALAVHEYEAWLLASLPTLSGQRGIPADTVFDGDVEALASPKGRFDGWMPSGYAETIDQPALTARIDVALARKRSPSFDKLVREIGKLLAP